MEWTINNDWQQLLTEEWDKAYMTNLKDKLAQEYATKTIYPAPDHIFYALELTPYASTKVVILGQDPYHGPNQAYGLSFSVQPDVKIPPSLRNIYKELASDIGCSVPASGCLDQWGKQGVLMLNAVLTVEAGQAGSHQRLGWQLFTDHIIKLLNDRAEPLVFILWGNYAQSKRNMINTERHCIIESVHPSPLSARRGFFGSKPFSQANQFLQQQGMSPINWCLEQ